MIEVRTYVTIAVIYGCKIIIAIIELYIVIAVMTGT